MTVTGMIVNEVPIPEGVTVNVDGDVVTVAGKLGQLVRTFSHPRVKVAQITSETYAGQYAHFVHPNLRGHTDLRFTPMAGLEPADLLFLALPHGHAMDHIEDWAAMAERIVDLSGDFRLRNPADYPRWYGHEHPAPDWLPRYDSGLPEQHREHLA